MPLKALYWLAFIPCLFCIYSFVCFWRIRENGSPYLKIIAVANLLYCCLTAGLVIYFRQQLTALGILYFVLEMVVITVLSIVELKIASRLRYKPVEHN